LLAARATEADFANTLMPDVVTVDVDDAVAKDDAPKPAPKPSSRWIRTRRALGFPLRFLVGLLKYLWHLAFGKRPIQ